nr:hypothetical protein [Tanacetum cinerariifolium]
MVESDTPKKQRLQEQIDAQVARELEEQQEKEHMRMNKQIVRDAEVVRIHAEEELQGMIGSLDRLNKTIAKYFQEYQDFALELPLKKRIELISDLVKYQENYSKVYKFQSQQRRPMSKKQKRDYYMDMIRNNLGWKVKDFKGTTFEEIEAKFAAVWKHVKDFIPMGSKEEAERLKRKEFNLEQEHVKKQKTSEEDPKIEKSTEEIPEEKMKEMMQLVRVEEVYVQALQVKHPITDWKVHTEGQRSYWKIIRLGGSSACYQFFIDLLKQLDREDLSQLWALVKEYLSIRPATSEKEMELWVKLKRLYKPDPEDQLWTQTQNFMHAPIEWKLYDLCGVHQVTAKDKDIFMLGNLQHALKDKEVIDSGCLRHMTGNMSYLFDFEELSGGYVAFGGNPKGGKISGKDEHQVLLRVPMEHNMYNVDLKNIVPSRDLTCLFAKATLDESNLWHRRLGHINFKTMNKLVKGNLVRGLPSKVFENDHTRVACKKATKDETSPILKTFITGIKNQLSLKVKIIRSDNGTKLKNNDLNQFCGMKGIKREFSVPRTPQQNGIAKMKNRTLTEAARTMLADSLLLIPFGAEAVNTTFYVQNRVLVTKPQNKTPYELLLSRTHSIGFMRPFGCPVTILNTLDPLGKFDGKVDEGFLVGYSVCSKAFRVFNSRTRIVQETLHINFLENKPNVAGSGPTWLFDIDTLTRTMNYQPVTAVNQSNPSAGVQEQFDAEKAGEDNEHEFERRKTEFKVHVSPSSKFKDVSDNSINEINASDSPVPTVGQISTNNTNTFSAAGPSNIVVSPTHGKSSYVDTSQSPNDPDMPELEDIIYSDDEEDVGAEADFTNLETNITVSPIPTTRVHKDHHVTPIIGDLSLATQTRSMTRVAKDQVARIEAIRLFLAYASFMGFMVYQIDVKSAFLYGTIEEEVFVCQPPGFEDPDYPDKKSDASEGFEQIIDFLNASSIKYALTVNPNTYVSCIKQFWTSVSVKKVNDVTRLQVLVDKKKVIITEATIRDALRLNESESIDCLPNKEIFTVLSKMGYEKPSTKLTLYKAFFLPQWKFLIHTILQCMSVKRTSWNKFSSSMASAIICLSTGMIVAQQADEGAAKVNVDDVPVAGVADEGAASVAVDDVPAAKLERRNKLKVSKLRRLKRVGTAQRVNTSDDTIIDDVSKHGRIIVSMDADVDVTLKDVADIAKEIAVDAEIEESADDDEVEPAELQEVVEIVTTAKLMTEVVTAASATITTADTPIPAATITTAAPTFTPAPSAARRRKGVVIRDPEETTTPSTIIHTKPKSKDKGKGILAELNKIINWDDGIDQVQRKEKEDNAMMRFKMDYFKGMKYDDIRLIFEKYFNSNVALLEKTKEQMEEEDSRALKRANESQAEKAAKKQKLDKEVEELKRHL